MGGFNRQKCIGQNLLETVMNIYQTLLAVAFQPLLSLLADSEALKWRQFILYEVVMQYWIS